MERIYALSTQISNLRLQGDDDGIDRLHRVYTSFILCLLAIVVSGKQYFGEPIYCWMNEKQLMLGHQKYADNYCWLTNTYYVPFDKPIPADIHKRHGKHTELSYYQWVPIILMMQAFIFYIPSAIWRHFNEKSGINIKLCVDMLSDAKNLNSDNRKKATKYVARYLTYSLSNYRESKTGKCGAFFRFLSRHYILCGKRHGNYLSGWYLLCKFLFIVNVITQLVLLDFYLKPDPEGPMYVRQFIDDFFKNHNWRYSGRFPRVTMCDFYIRVLANVQRHTVQCVLPLNLFNEKVFIFFWFWFVILSIVTILNFFVWFFQIVVRRSRERIIKRHFTMISDHSGKKNSGQFSNFVNEYLRADGVFVLRMMSVNTSSLAVQEITHALWDVYEEDYSSVEDNTLP